MAITLEQAQAVHSAYIQREYHYKKIADGYMVKYQLGKITKEEWDAHRHVATQQRYPAASVERHFQDNHDRRYQPLACNHPVACDASAYRTYKPYG